MRFIHFYLAGYFILVLGAGLSLWQAGVLAQISAVWTLTAALVAIGLGLMLAVISSSSRPVTAGSTTPRLAPSTQHSHPAPGTWHPAP